MPPPSLARARRRRRLWSWLPAAVLTVVCGLFVAGAVAMQNSWWLDPDAPVSADQETADGLSRFDRAGEDYFVREGVARLSLRPGAAAADDLGLEAEDSRTLEPLVPVTVVILVPDGVLTMASVAALTVDTADDRIRSVTLVPDLSGSWQAVSAELRRTAPTWGWSDAELARLEDDLTAAARASEDGAAEARLAPHALQGVWVSAVIRVDGAVSLAYTVATE